MLPVHVTIVLLSATIPNYKEFADWVGRIRNRKVYVQMTLYRPVPLEHYLLINGEATLVKTQDKFFPEKITKVFDKHIKKNSNK